MSLGRASCTVAVVVLGQDKILSIIQTGFGSMDAFNQAIQRVMVRIDGLSDRRPGARTCSGRTPSHCQTLMQMFALSRGTT